MGKHNGKARTSGVRVGAALTKQARRVRGLSCMGNICHFSPAVTAPASSLLLHSTRITMQEGKGGKTMVSNAFIHSTDPDSTAINTQSILENNDLTELMSMVSQQDYLKARCVSGTPHSSLSSMLRCMCSTI